MKLEPGEAKITPMGHEAFIVKEIGGQRFDALVPASVMGENLGSVPVNYVGDTDDGRVVLHFPVSNEGRPRWAFPKEYLEPLIIVPEASGQSPAATVGRNANGKRRVDTT